MRYIGLVVLFSLFLVSALTLAAQEARKPSSESDIRKARLALTAGTTKVNPKDGLTYVWVPSGRFMMGCSVEDRYCSEDEKPAHEVVLGKGFWVGQTPVTQAAYQRVRGNNPSSFKGDHLPVENVGWKEARSYCKVVGMRLPTEAEWEYAARAGSPASRYGELEAIAWYYSNSENRTHAVGEKQANAWMLYDMLGNVWQWTSDWYNSGYYSRSMSQDPKGPASGAHRVLRGGSWNLSARDVRVSNRNNFLPENGLIYTGFRCVEGAD